MYDDYSYLIHSAKGSTWSKGDHKYISKEKKNGKWRYIYKMAQKAADDATRDEIARRAKENEEANRIYGHEYYDDKQRRKSFGENYDFLTRDSGDLPDGEREDYEKRTAVKLMNYHGLNNYKNINTKKRQDDFKRKGYFK